MAGRDLTTCHRDGGRETQRIVFVLPDLSGGGAARVASILCGEWVKAGHEVHLVTYEEPGAASVYPLDSRIVRHQIGASVSPRGLAGFVANNTRRVTRLRRTLREVRPTAIIAFLAEANMSAVLAGFGLGIPVLISERNHPGHHTMSRINAFLRRCIYPRASRLCVQTQDIRDWFRVNLGIEAGVVPNPVSQPENPAPRGAAVKKPGERAVAISLGRLEPQKGYDDLIGAFASIASEVPEWDVVIHGEGGQRATLERQIEKLGMEGRIFLPGATKTPIAALRMADLYLHPARYEGFPNAVLEALSCGLCIVATDCPGGTGEILQGNAYGILVPGGDAGALAGAMRRAMQDETLRARYAAEAANGVRIYAPDKIAARWMDEIEKCTQGTHRRQ